MEFQNANSRSVRSVHQESVVPLFAAGVLCLIIGGIFASQFEPPALALGITGLMISAIFVPFCWPYGALVVLIAATVMPEFSAQFGGWNARPEHFAGLMVALAIVFRWLVGSGTPISFTAVDYFVIGYVFCNYASSVMGSPDPKLTLRWALLNNLVILPYFLVRILVRDEEALRRVFKAFLTIGIAESTYAVAASASSHAFGTSFGVDVDQYATGLGGIYGTQSEPNLLGSYCACLAIMLLILYFLDKRRPRWVMPGAVLALGGLFVSLSRAAILAFACAALVVLFIGLRSGRIRTKQLVRVTLMVGLLLAPILIANASNISSRFANWSDKGVRGDADTVGRILEWAVAIQTIQEHPILGNGTASFQLLADAKQLPILGDRPWVGNYLIRILNDSGLVGLVLFGIVAVRIGKEAKDCVERRVRGYGIIIALVAGCLVYAIAFLSTDGTMLSFFWVHVGLLSSACALFGQGSRRVRSAVAAA
jgi:O-antigen ligase